MKSLNPAIGTITKINESRSLLLWPVFAYVFLFQPFFSIMLCILLAFFIKEKSAMHLYVIVILVAAYLGLVNLTKLPESDLAVYIQSLRDAKDLELGSFLLLYSREPLYYVGMYYLGNIPQVDYRHYIFLSTFIAYLIFALSVIRISLKLQLSHPLILGVVVCLLFFPQLFNLSAHLMRQFLASSILMLFLSFIYTSGQKRWLLAVIAFFIHYSTVAIILSLQVRNLSRLSSSLFFIAYLILLPTAFAGLVIVSFYLVELPIVGIIFSRLSDAGDNGATHEAFGLVHFVFSSVILIMVLFNLSGKRALRRGTSGWTINLMSLIIAIAVLLTSLRDDFSLITLRFFFFLYFLIGMILPFSLKKLGNTRILHCLTYPIVVMTIVLFLYNTQTGAWSYASVLELVAMPSWGFWNYRAF